MTAPGTSRRDLPVLAALLLLAAGHIAWMSFLCDDAFIAFRYAANLAGGAGPVFQTGERVEGTTSFLWMALLAGGARLGAPPERIAGPLGGTVAVAALAVVLARRRRAGRGFVPAGVLIATSAGWAAWSTGGLETALFGAILLLAFVALRESIEDGHSRGRTLANGALLGAAALTRPEGVLVALGTGAWLLGEARRGRLARSAILPWLLAWGLPTAAHVAFRLAWYGAWLPSPAYAKAAGISRLGDGLAYLGIAAARLHLWIPLFALAFALAVTRGAARDELARTVRLLGWTSLPVAAVVAVYGGDFMDLGRLVVPLLAPFLLVAGEALGAGARRGTAAAIGVGALLLAYTGLNHATARDARQEWTRRGVDSIGLLARYVDDWSRLGRRLREIAAPNDVVATGAAGCVPYWSGLRAIDQHGLVAPDLAPYRRVDPPRPGHALVLRDEALLAARPRWIVGSPRVRAAGEPPRGAFLVGEAGRAELARGWRPRDLVLPGPDERRCLVLERRDGSGPAR